MVEARFRFAGRCVTGSNPKEPNPRTANPPWRAACMSRRLAILYDAPVSATESGKTANTDNPYFSLLPEMEVEGIQKFLGS